MPLKRRRAEPAAETLSIRLAKRFAPTLVLFPEDHQRPMPYSRTEAPDGRTGDFRPCPVEMVLDRSLLSWPDGRPFSRPPERATDKDWLFDLIKRENLELLAEAVIKLQGVEVDNPGAVWDHYFQRIVGPVPRSSKHKYPFVTYVRVVSARDLPTLRPAGVRRILRSPGSSCHAATPIVDRPGVVVAELSGSLGGVPFQTFGTNPERPRFQAL